MSAHAASIPAAVIPFAPAPKAQPEANVGADDNGRSIMALLQKAADMAKEDCSRAIDLAHRLSFQLRTAEERLREAEAETAHYRDCAARAEQWLMRIHSEVEQRFFQKKERDAGHVARQ
jgi:hypothetical protein